MGTWCIAACLCSLAVIASFRDYSRKAAGATKADAQGKNFVQEPSFAANFRGPRV